MMTTSTDTITEYSEVHGDLSALNKLIGPQPIENDRRGNVCISHVLVGIAQGSDGSFTYPIYVVGKLLNPMYFNL